MITEIVTNVCIMGALAVIANEYLSKLTKVSGFLAQFQAWVVAVLLATLASYLGIGIFPNASFIATILYGFLIGLVSNGIFDIPYAKTVLTWIKARIA